MPSPLLPPEARPFMLRMESIRKTAGVPVTLVAEVMHVNKLTYYAWVRGSPMRAENKEKLIMLAKAMVAACKKVDLPVPRRSDLTLPDWRAKVRRILLDCLSA